MNTTLLLVDRGGDINLQMLMVEQLFIVFAVIVKLCEFHDNLNALESTARRHDRMCEVLCMSKTCLLFVGIFLLV